MTLGALLIATKPNRLLPVVGSALGVAFTLWGGEAAAQGGTQPGSGRQINFDLTGRVTYDSNVARGGQAVADARNLRRDDILYAPAVDVDLVLPLARQAVFLNGAVGYEFYQYNHDLSRERIDLSGGVMGQAGPCSGTLTSSYARHQSDQADLDVTVTKNTEQMVSFGAQISCPISGRIGQNLSVQHTSNTNSAKGGVEDSDVFSVVGGLSYGNPRLGTANLTLSYSKVNYDDVTSTLRLGSPDYQTYAATVGYSRQVGARLRGNVSLGYTKVDQSGQPDGGYSGWSGSGALSYKVGPRLTAKLSYDRSVSPSIREGTGYQLTTLLQVDADYTISSRLRASIGANWGDRSYRSGSALSPVGITSEDNQSQFASATFDVGRSAKFTLEGRREVRNTNLTLFDYEAYRVSAIASATF